MTDDKKVAPFKLQPGSIKDYLKEFEFSNDGEFMLFTTLSMNGLGLEQLNKYIEEGKDVYNCDLGNNNIPDPSFLKEFQQLIRLDLANNKVKNINIFT